MVIDGLDGVTNAEDEVMLTYIVTNTGNTCLRNVAVDDPSAGTLQCTAEFSGPGSKTRYTDRGGATRKIYCENKADVQIVGW